MKGRNRLQKKNNSEAGYSAAKKTDVHDINKIKFKLIQPSFLVLEYEFVSSEKRTDVLAGNSLSRCFKTKVAGPQSSVLLMNK